MCQKGPEANAEEDADLVVTRALEAPMDALEGRAHWASNVGPRPSEAPTGAPKTQKRRLVHFRRPGCHI